MKKKILRPIIASLVALVIPLGLVTSASAEVTPGNPGTSTITLTGDESYTITIPSTYAFGTLAKSAGSSCVYLEGDVTVTDKMLTAGNYIHIGFDNTTVWNLLVGGTDNTKTVAYDVYAADGGTSTQTALDHSKDLLTVADTATGTDLTTKCYVGIDRQNIANTGSYSGVLKFTVTVNSTGPTV